MTRRLRGFFAIAAAFVILSAGDCDISSLGNLLEKPGTVSVTNIGSEPAVVAIIVGDVKSYPPLAAGATASAETNVGGTYEVRVVMTPENSQAYRDKLTELRRTVERLIDGSASPDEKTRLFLDLAGIRAAILAFEHTNAAGCSGRITLERDEPTSVIATVNWLTTADGGFWETTCGSNR